MAPKRSHVLNPLVVPAADPARVLDELEAAIAGEASLLPVPDNDEARARRLVDSQLAGRPIDPEVAVVVATSGSTGPPKGAELTAANLVSSADATHRRLGGPGQWLLAMPAHHIAGLQVLVRSLVAGVEPYCLNLSSGFSIEEFARGAAELDRTGDRSYTALTPMQLAKALDELAGIDALRTFDAVLVGGGPLDESLRSACERLGINAVATYGSAETSGGLVYDGRPLSGARGRVERGSGRIVVGGPMVARGYRNRDSNAFPEPGWFRTSDAGRLDEDGVLHVEGRIDQVISTGGLKLHPEVLERALRAIPGVAEAAVAGVPDPRFGQAVVAAYEGTAAAEDVYAGLEDLPRWQLPKQLRRVESLPRAALGKVDRGAVARLFSTP